MIPTRPFGRTGHQSTRVIFGAAAFSRVDQATADRTMERIIEAGLNHIDTAASYGDSELRLGPWMARERDRFFLATKTGERAYAEARDQIHRSLERLRTDRLDLIQLHNLAQEEEWQVAMGPGGALEAAVEAREQGLVRFIGVTGHGLGIAAMHRRGLERFNFDSVLFPYSYVLLQNPAYAADVEALLTICAERDLAVQTIKSVTKRPWGERPEGAATWYEPLEDQADIDLAVHWVLGQPRAFLNTASSVDLLPRIIDAASRYQHRPAGDQMDALVNREAMAPLFV